MDIEFSQNEFTWLVIFLVYNNSTYKIETEVNDRYIKMELQKNSLFKAIEDSPFHEKIKIVIVEAGIGFTLDETGSKKITQDFIILEKAGNSLLPLHRPGSVPLTTMSDVYELSAVISNIVAQFPAKRNAWVCFGHGSIFGIHYLDKSQIQTGPSGQEPTGHDKTKNDHALAHHSLELLTNKKLGEVISRVYGSRKLDILAMHNCLMQNVFTQYELSACVDLFVAPASGICHPGFHYREIFSRLTNDPGLENEELATLFLDTLSLHRTPLEDLYFGTVSHTWKLHIVKLDEGTYNEFRMKFRELFSCALQLGKKNYKVFYSVKVTNRQLFNNASYALPRVKMVELSFFLRYWLETIKGFVSLTPLEDPITNLIEVINKIKTTTYTGDGYYKHDYSFVDPAFQKNKINEGFSIWIPDKTAMENSPLFNEILNPQQGDLSPTLLESSGFQELFREYLNIYI